MYNLVLILIIAYSHETYTPLKLLYLSKSPITSTSSDKSSNSTGNDDDDEYSDSMQRMRLKSLKNLLLSCLSQAHYDSLRCVSGYLYELWKRSKLDSKKENLLVAEMGLLILRPEVKITEAL